MFNSIITFFFFCFLSFMLFFSHFKLFLKFYYFFHLSVFCFVFNIFLGRFSNCCCCCCCSEKLRSQSQNSIKHK